MTDQRSNDSSMSSPCKTALVIGASRGIGSSISEMLLAEGWHVITPTRNELDLTNGVSLNQFLDSFDCVVDAVIFSAGQNTVRPMKEVTEGEFLDSFHLHVLAPFLIVQRLISAGKLPRGSSVVFISSLYSLVGRKGRLVYSTTKHATIGLVKGLALELGRRDIRINSVVPGFVDTDMTRRNLGESGIEKVTRMIPLGDVAEVKKIAEVVLSLCDGNSYLTGQSVVVDGGLIIGGFWDDN